MGFGRGINDQVALSNHVGHLGHHHRIFLASHVKWQSQLLLRLGYCVDAFGHGIDFCLTHRAPIHIVTNQVVGHQHIYINQAETAKSAARRDTATLRFGDPMQ